ncbi:3-isopropylmalate dehydratase small subunit [Actinokineospora xionganensis]|uniref:3-isopropylmalate dehydratase small subunit n=1 Tax=Actinokineospora xionganensis TaxID=2684470 RepID=A0ABR7L503_9PSEU|nr:3-isopropylmalate dehydratase small subunit [Actinokineospora xionganensis]MBC6447412.1 3-isopropylmalate dehydratase small subunit [Actinokineospora xionganensis]
MTSNLDARITAVTGSTVVIEGNDIDTDRIIPARFLKHLTFDALGDHVFEDDRKQDRARGVTHPFDEEARRGASILLTAKNFGCGSSREHAAQALYRWGVRAVVGESFGEIFRGNCGTIGLPCLTISAEDAKAARAIGAADPAAVGEVDLEKGVFVFGGREFPVEISQSLRDAFAAGTWDTLTELLKSADDVAGTAARLPYLNGFHAG